MSASAASTTNSRHQRRSSDRRSEYRFVRAVQGGTGTWFWQARAWLPEPIGSVNLGCYREERAAWDAVRQWIRAGGDPCKGLPPGVLPKWVLREREGDKPTGRFLAVRRDRNGTRIVVGAFGTAEQAHLAARRQVEAELIAAATAAAETAPALRKPGGTPANAPPPSR